MTIQCTGNVIAANKILQFTINLQDYIAGLPAHCLHIERIDTESQMPLFRLAKAGFVPTRRCSVAVSTTRSGRLLKCQVIIIVSHLESHVQWL